MAIEYKWYFHQLKKSEDSVIEAEWEYMKVVDNKKEMTNITKTSNLNIPLNSLTEDNLKAGILSSLGKTEEDLQNEFFVVSS